MPDEIGEVVYDSVAKVTRIDRDGKPWGIKLTFTNGALLYAPLSDSLLAAKSIVSETSAPYSV